MDVPLFLRTASELNLHRLWFLILVLEAMIDECVVTHPGDVLLCAYICMYSMYLDKIET